MSSGILAGFPVVDVRTTLYDGSYHDVDSSVAGLPNRSGVQLSGKGMRKCGAAAPGADHEGGCPMGKP